MIVGFTHYSSIKSMVEIAQCMALHARYMAFGMGKLKTRGHTDVG